MFEQLKKQFGLDKEKMKEINGGFMSNCSTCVINSKYVCRCCVKADGSGYVVPFSCKYIGDMA